jgi:hypothetical protein
MILRGSRAYVALLIALAVAAGLGAGIAVVPTLLTVAAVAFLGFGLAALAIPRRWVSPLAATILVVLVVVLPTTPSPALLSFGPASGTVTLALMALFLVAVVVLRNALHLGQARGFLLSAATFIAIYAATTLINDPGSLPALFPHAVLWTSAALIGLFTSREQVRYTLLLIALIAAGESVIALAEYFFGIVPPFSSFLEAGYVEGASAFTGEVARSRGTFGHPIPLAAFLAATLPIVWWVMPHGARLLSTLRVPLLILLVSGIFVSFSRSSWVALAILVVVFIIARQTTLRSRILLLMLLLCVLIISSALGLGSLVLDRFEGVTQTGSFQQRVLSLGSVPAILDVGTLHALLGNGFRSSSALYAQGTLESIGNFQVVDNQFISLLADIGLLGLGAFISVVAIAWSRLRAVGRLEFGSVGSRASEAMAIRYALFSLLVVAFFFEMLIWPSSAVPFWLLLGLAFAYRVKQK